MSQGYGEIEMKGSNYEAIGWSLFLISIIIFGYLEPAGSIVCCGIGLIGLLIAQIGHDKKKKEKQMALQTVYVQQPSPVVIQQPIYVPTPAPASAPLPAPDPPRKVPEKYWESEQWTEKGRNLELARDWEGAAQAYQKAGLFSEAGRVRETHLEKDKYEDKVVVNIDRIGDNVLHDSVMYNEEDAKGSN